MDNDTKLSLIERFGSALAPLVDFVKTLPAGALDYRPELPDAWTIREHAVHVLDADTFAYGRLRLAVTQPGVEVFVWNEEAWQQRAKYQTADALACLATAQALRDVVCAMAKALVDANWEDLYVRHAQRGRMTLADVLILYINHAQVHLNYFRRNLDAFSSAPT
jgi:uncharacterized damage-inducible protein DinB